MQSWVVPRTERRLSHASDPTSAIPPTKQFLHVFAKEAAGSKTDRPEYRGGVGERLLLRCPPHAADLHGGGGGRRREHQQAGAQ